MNYIELIINVANEDLNTVMDEFSVAIIPIKAIRLIYGTVVDTEIGSADVCAIKIDDDITKELPFRRQTTDLDTMLVLEDYYALKDRIKYEIFESPAPTTEYLQSLVFAPKFAASR